MTMTDFLVDHIKGASGFIRLPSGLSSTIIHFLSLSQRSFFSKYDYFHNFLNISDVQYTTMLF